MRMSVTLGTPLQSSAFKVLLLGSGELGKEVVISLQRLGVEVHAADRYDDAPAMQVAHYSYTLNMADPVELKQLNIDAALEKVFQALESDFVPKQGIFFEGQLFDAYVFVSQLIKQATKRIILFDHYVDENTLMLLSKRRKNVQCVIYAKPNPHLQKDLEKHNRQYAPIEWIENKGSHDRFLILDTTQLNQIGAS